MESNALFIRFFYNDLYTAVLGRAIRAEGSRGAVILGSPGIGKSAFGLYVLFRVVREGRTVIYVSGHVGSALFKHGKAFAIGGSVSGLPELSEPGAVYISDSLRPEGAGDVFTLVVTSPKKKVWSDLNKSPGVSQLTLPVFDEAELEALRALAFEGKAGCSPAAVRALCGKWGYNPRNVLTMSAKPDWQRYLESAPSVLPIAQLELALSKTTAMRAAASNALVHCVVNLVPAGKLPMSQLSTRTAEYYDFHHAELASAYVEEKFLQALDERDTDGVYSFLHKTATEAAASSFRGKLYERFVVIPRARDAPGPAFACEPANLSLRRLDDWTLASRPALLTAATLNLAAPLPVVRFRDAAELQEVSLRGTKTGMYIPRSPEFPTIDLVWIIGGQPLLVNCTVSDSHDVKAGNDRFEAAVRALGFLDEGRTGEIPFLWALPQTAFSKFDKPGPVKSASGSVLVTGPTSRTPIARRLAQYALLVAVPPGRKVESLSADE